jgi:hypothetical protein
MPSKPNAKKAFWLMKKTSPSKLCKTTANPVFRPGDGRAEARQTRRQEIENAKKKYRVITYNCYSP